MCIYVYIFNMRVCMSSHLKLITVHHYEIHTFFQATFCLLRRASSCWHELYTHAGLENFMKRPATMSNLQHAIQRNMGDKQ